MWITVGRTIVHNRGRAKERDFRSFRFEGIERLRNRRRWIYDVDGIPLKRRAFDFFPPPRYFYVPWQCPCDRGFIRYRGISAR